MSQRNESKRIAIASFQSIVQKIDKSNIDHPTTILLIKCERAIDNTAANNTKTDTVGSNIRIKHVHRRNEVTARSPLHLTNVKADKESYRK